MKIFKKTINNLGRTHIYFCGIKILSYKTNVKTFLKWCFKMPDWNNLPTHTLQSKTDIKNSNIFPKIAIIYPVYYQHNDFRNLNKLLKKYDKEYTPELKQQMEIILVDDGSKYPINIPENCNLNITLLRILKDIPWNNSGARNLGACYTTAQRIILSDMDFFIPMDTLQYCIQQPMSDTDFFALTIQERNEAHPNIYAMTKRGYMKQNGYDEQWCGFYGEDIPFRIRLNQNKINFIDTKKIIIQNEEKKEHHLSRDLTTLITHMNKWDGNTTHKMLQFPWKFVDERKYKNP